MTGRAPLPTATVARIRDERRRPRPVQWDYLHLRALRDGLGAAVAAAGRPDGPALDLWCGAQPYRYLLGDGPVWGYDLDRHFGGADVLGGPLLPFRSGAFGLVLCTQALYLVDDDTATVAEMRRVLAPGGVAVVTVPRIFRRELATERRYRRRDLDELFAGWRTVEVEPFGGLGTGLAFVAGRVAYGAARRWRPARAALPVVAVVLAGAGLVLDAVTRPLRRRTAAGYVVTASP